MQFVKMEGLGNDFVVVRSTEAGVVDKLRSKVATLCDRRCGIGADGVIVVLPGEKADFRMRIFNADGSEAEMCGNGIRCLALFAYQEKLSEKAALSIETGAGLIHTERIGDRIRVNMGPPILDAAKVPTMQHAGRVVNKELEVLDKRFAVTAVSMGNPHAVIFVDTITDELIHRYGAALEQHPFFPRRVNVEFVQVLSRSEARMRVWERGCGETQACGTGTCASVVAGIENNLFDDQVTVHLLGGDLHIAWDGNESHSVFMTGPARRVFSGTVEIS